MLRKTTVRGIRQSIVDNPLNTDKQKLKFKKDVLNAVDDYLKFILKDIASMHSKLKRNYNKIKNY